MAILNPNATKDTNTAKKKFAKFALFAPFAFQETHSGVMETITLVISLVEA